MREYFIKPKGALEWWDTPNTESLARTVYEADEVFDIGLLDAAGNKIMAREKMRPIGFFHLKERDDVS